MLITGVSGLLGNNIARFFRDDYEILGFYHSHPVFIDGIQLKSVNLLSKEDVTKSIKDFEPDVLIHCASLTDVDFCETEKELTKNVNVLGTRTVAESILKSLCKLVYISTDLVYDGKKGNYSENDPVNPLNYYGLSKLEGEQEVLRKPNALVLRTNIFGWNIQNKLSLAEWILQDLSAKKSIAGFQDVTFSSIYTFDLAKLLALAIEHDLRGIYNCGSSSPLSKYEFALQIAERFNLDKSLVKPGSVNDFHFKAKRAKKLSLDLTKLTKDLNIVPPKVTESLDNFYRDFQKGLPQKIKKNNQSEKNYPQLDFIPYGRQCIDNEDIQAVVEVLKSHYLAQGPKITEFEAALCQITGARFAIVVNSGTSALHIACLAAGIKPGSEVVTTSNTFVASANCIVYCGGKPVFADIDPKTYNISAEEIERKVGEKCHAIIPVHFAGQSCPMAQIRKAAEKKERWFDHKIYIIEDASHALGSYYRDVPVGSCSYSDMTVMSFHPVKHITTGEGGAVLTNNEELYQKLKLFRSHGITSDASLFVNHEMAFSSAESGTVEPNPWHYEQIELGYNYRITDIQCALGISQIVKLERFRARRLEIVRRYNEVFSDLPGITTPFQHEENNSNFHLYVLLFDFEELKISRAKLMKDLRQRGIVTQVHYIPVHTQPYYQTHFGTKWGDCLNTEKYYQRCLSLPLYPAMTDPNVHKVIETVSSLIKR